MLSVDEGLEILTPVPSDRQRLTDLRSLPQSRKRRKRHAPSTPANPDEIQVDNEKWRVLDRDIRWETLLFTSPFCWETVVKNVFGEAISMDSYEAMTARSKIFYHVKAYKCQVLDAVESHVRDMMNGHPFLKDSNISRSTLVQQFDRQFSPENFLNCWVYIQGYVDISGSSTLANYYLKRLNTIDITMIQ
ncbi:hypothetical protein LPUS_04269 [Lasallia pustulata]|uniref:Uncharacterized protein n=1 Tax=Lasallia pustulata TaxID=136370 RepID=A0A1W5CWD9_9LECA|nr:hypothetical protein LPUS_04269 [Lasallia pustulata]